MSIQLDSSNRCKHLFVNRDYNQPYICKTPCSSWDIACKFTDDWDYAKLRCKCYEERPSNYKIVVECNGVTVLIGEGFTSEEDIRAALPPWLIMDFVKIKKW